MKRALEDADTYPVDTQEEEDVVVSQDQSNKTPPRNHKLKKLATPNKSILEKLPSDITNCLALKFVNREKEADLMVTTLAGNRKGSNLSQAKLVSLFQTYGIGKTSLVRKFREVYDHKNNGIWPDEFKWIKDLKMLEIDFRFFKIRSGSTISDMGVEIAKFVTDLYYEQFIEKETNVEPDLLERRRVFHAKLQIAANEGRKFYKTFDNNDAKEGYLLFFDEVDNLLNYNLDSVDLQDKNWPKDCYIDRFLHLWQEVIPLLVSECNAVIFSGHTPVHLSLDRSKFKKGSSPSDYCLVFLSPMSNQVIEKMLNQSIVSVDNQSFPLLSIFTLLGLKDVNEFIQVLREYTGTVPRIMYYLFKSIISNKNDLSTKEKICEACEESIQKQVDVTVCIENEEEAKLLSHLYLLHKLGIAIPSQTKLFFNKRHRNFIEILPYFNIHFQFNPNGTVDINIPKLLQIDLLKKLSSFETSISRLCYYLLKTKTPSLLIDTAKALEFSIIDLLSEQMVARRFRKMNEITKFADLCGGIFAPTFFSGLELPPNFLTTNFLIPGFLEKCNTTKYSSQEFGEYLSLCNEAFISVIDDVIDKEFSAAIPGTINTGFDILLTLQKTNKNVLRKLILFECKLFEKDFTLIQLQKEIDQAASLLPKYTVDEKPTLDGENLHFTLVMVVTGYSDSVKKVIENNSSANGSLLIRETTYLNSHNELCTQHVNGQKSWLKLKGGMEVLLLSDTGLKNLLSTDLYNYFIQHSQNKQELYKNMFCNYIQENLFHLEASESGDGRLNDLAQSTPKLENIVSSENIESSRNKFNKLQLVRIIGNHTIDTITLDKSDCSTWSADSIKQLLITPLKKGGIGLVEEQVEGVRLFGSTFENIIDALLSCEGGKEVRIKHACDTPSNIADLDTRQSIVRWIFKNLIEIK